MIARFMARLLLPVASLLCAAALAGCPKPAPPSQSSAARIVCFSPAVTQILFDMGLGEQVVGVTQFARLPAGVSRPTVGDAFNVNSEAVLALRPTVIFTQITPDKFRGLREIDPRVQVVQIRIETLADVSAAIERVGKVVNRPQLASETRGRFAAGIDKVARRTAGLPRPRTLFVMGTDRPIAAGPGTFMADLIAAGGGANAGADIPGSTRWRPTHIEAILKSAPDVLVCQVESGGNEDEARRYWLKWQDLPAARARRVYVVSDPRWSIPSTHLAELAVELAEVLHPSVSIGPASAPAAPPAANPTEGPAAPATKPAAGGLSP